MIIASFIAPFQTLSPMFGAESEHGRTNIEQTFDGSCAALRAE